MRYYSLVITDQSGNLYRPPSLAPARLPSSYSSLDARGNTLPNALDVLIDVGVVPYATPIGTSLLRVWGVSLPEISQASNLNGYNIAVYAGMQKGLPLANPAQAGILIQGQIFQAFGNWIGTDQTLDMLIQPSTGEINAPKNIVVNWKGDTSLSEAIIVTLLTAFPDHTVDSSISPRLKLPYDVTGYYANVTQLAQWIKQFTASIIGGSYTGVEILVRQNSFSVYDSTAEKTPRQIVFQDLIGQPTWIDFSTIQFKCPMRADINVGDFVKLPPTLVTTTSQSFSQFRNQSAFQGSFQVNQIRHVGHFRQPDSASWATVVNGFASA